MLSFNQQDSKEKNYKCFEGKLMQKLEEKIKNEDNSHSAQVGSTHILA